MSYPDRNGKRIRESTLTQDWQEANRKLRERLLARDDKVLEIVKKVSNWVLSNGWIFPWRTIPSRLCVLQRLMK